MTEIPLSKKKILLLFLGSLIFVAAGLEFLIDPSKFSQSATRHYPVWEIFAVGCITVFFCGACAIVGAYKLFDNKPGIIINEEGIIDNSSGVSLGLVKWSDISGTKVQQVATQKFLLVYIKNPDQYMEKQSGWFKRKMIAGNYKMYETPMAISSNALKCNFDELVNLINKNVEAHARGLRSFKTS